MCLGTFSRRGAVASATIYPRAECASSRSIFIVWKRSFLYDKKESCEAGFSACGGSRKRHSSIPLQCDPRGAFIIVWKRSFLYDKKECALAHSRAEARLLQQPSTTAPSAHLCKLCLLLWNREFYRNFLFHKKSVSKHLLCHETLFFQALTYSSSSSKKSSSNSSSSKSSSNSSR